MPATRVVFFRDVDGRAPVAEWLEELRLVSPKAFAKCAARLERLRAMGHELRRPEADFLRNGVHELRSRLGTVQYRLLYFFHGRDVAILAHALTKEAEVPARDIELAVRRMNMFAQNPGRHTDSREV